jgi:hypothetical protein
VHPLILVSLLVIAGVAVLGVVALWRGWLRLKSVPADSRVHFILIGKKLEPPRAVGADSVAAASPAQLGNRKEGPVPNSPAEAR